IGLPTAIVAGPLFGRFITRRVQVTVGAIGGQLSGGPDELKGQGEGPSTINSPTINSPSPRRLPGFGITVFTVLLPVMLIMGASAADLVLDKQSTGRAGIDFIGHPTVAMLLAVLFSFYSFGVGIGFG